jgi:hypothetical protein
VKWRSAGKRPRLNGRDGREKAEPRSAWRQDGVKSGQLHPETVQLRPGSGFGSGASIFGSTSTAGGSITWLEAGWPHLQIGSSMLYSPSAPLQAAAGKRPRLKFRLRFK